MRIPDLILKKRDNGRLSAEEIEAFVSGVCADSIPEEQIGALLMAIFFQGLDKDETVALTRSMLHSGEVMQWPELGPHVADKHSTGGVGDKISLPLAPALAACGLKVPMVSGRGLGHTGGTLDKLESIPGYQTRLSQSEIRAIVQKVGCVICGQTEKVAPADKRIYSIRDITGTVESIPLITASILSKKAAAGLASLVLDVKVGIGAFMRNIEDARALAQSLVRVGGGLGIKTVALLTEMDHPIGSTIGNALEVRESIECLRGDGPDDLVELVTVQGGTLLHAAGKSPNVKEGVDKIHESLNNGSALKRFAQMVEAVGGNPEVVHDPEGILPKAKSTLDIKATSKGFLQSIDSLEAARVALELGAGRNNKEDEVDPAVGIEVLIPRGSAVDEETPVMRIHHQGNFTEDHLQRLHSATSISAQACPPKSRILESIENQE